MLESWYGESQGGNLQSGHLALAHYDEARWWMHAGLRQCSGELVSIH